MSLLKESEIIGIKTAYLNRVGCFGLLACDGCTRKEELNCDMSKTGTSVLFSEYTGEYTTCPLNYIGRSVADFIKRYAYYEKYPSTAPSYEQASERFLEAVNVYEQIKYEYENDNKGSSKTNENLEKMRGLQ